MSLLCRSSLLSALNIGELVSTVKLHISLHSHRFHNQSTAFTLQKYVPSLTAASPDRTASVDEPLFTPILQALSLHICIWYHATLLHHISADISQTNFGLELFVTSQS
jgi:hypothetical protein